MNKKKCDVCGGIFTIRALQKCKKRLICKVCKKREEKEKGFVNMLDIVKEERVLNKIKQIKKKVVKETKEKATNERETIFPKMRGSRVRKTFNRQLRMGLSFDEQKFLLTKHMRLGLNFEQAKEKIREDKEFLKEFVKKMRVKEKSEEEINKRFKEEFVKLYEK